jgi:RNA methyltransferase, TrmH family
MNIDQISAQNAQIQRFQRARRDPELAVLEGFHALKHAFRFQADVLEVAATDPARLERFAQSLAPDLSGRFAAIAGVVEPSVFVQLAPKAARTAVIALAKRRTGDVGELLADPRPAPAVMLENPRDLGNLGACVRVCAAADAAGVLTTGSHDPWNPDALRGAAGLHYAIPVAHVERVPSSDRPVIAIDTGGEPFQPSALEPRALLVFGSERDGLSEQLLARADARLSIPMHPGVSSLNLATSVAAILFAWRLGRDA